MPLPPDLLNEHFNNLTSWTDADIDTAVSEIDPAGQLRLDTNLGAAGNAIASRIRTITSPPDKFTIEFKAYCDDIGTRADADFLQVRYDTATWRIQVSLATDGFFVYKTGGGNTEVGTNIVSEGVWQTWRLEVDKSGGEASATVEVFLNGISKGTVDCDYEIAGTDGRVWLRQFGYTTNNMVSHIDYIQIATGLGEISQDISKINGIDILSISKINGVDISAILKINGVYI